MKKVLIILVFVLYSLAVNAQKFELGFNGRFGGTIVDVAEAMGYTMEDWSTWCYGGYFQGFYVPTKNIAIGLDLGYQVLYYYEYRNYYGYWNWGNIGTFHVGPTLQLQGFNLYAQGGVHLHAFSNGVVPGLMGAAGYKIPITDHFSIPIGIRGDIIFGDAVPIAATLTIGLSFKP